MVNVLVPLLTSAAVPPIFPVPLKLYAFGLSEFTVMVWGTITSFSVMLCGTPGELSNVTKSRMKNLSGFNGAVRLFQLDVIFVSQTLLL